MVHRPVAPARSVRCRPVVSRHLCGGPAGGARGAFRRAGAAAARAAVPDRRRAVSAGFPLDRQHLLRAPPAAAGAPGLLLLLAADAQRHAAGHGRDGLVPVGPAVRGGGLRRADPDRRVGGARRLLRARPRDPGRAQRPRMRSPRSTCPTPTCGASPKRARERVLAEHTSRHGAPATLDGLLVETRAAQRRRRTDGGLACGGSCPPPARGSRIQPLAFSKELLPVGSRLDGGVERPCAVSEYLVERMIRGGADKICFVISPGKSDILEYYGAGYGDAAIAYVVQPRPSGLCDAIFRAAPLIAADEPVIVGLPDTIWFPEDGARRAAGRRAVVPALSRGAAGVLRRRRARRGRARAGDPGEANRTPRRTGSGARSRCRAACSPSCTSSGSERGCEDEYFGTLVNAWLARGRRGGGRQGGRRLRRCRHAERLSRGDRPARRAASAATDGAAGTRVRARLARRARAGRSSRREPGVQHRHERHRQALDPTDLRRAPRRSARGSTTSTSTACRPRPNHFLGDYPSVKWRSFADAIPRI